MIGDTNISDDPQFVDPVNGNFHLQESSPCIDTGNPNSPLDPDSTRADMGAYYYPQMSGIHNDPNPDHSLTYALYSNYPNPFNPQTTFTFSLPIAGHASLIVYDVTGRKVATVLVGRLDAGVHQFTWNAEGLPSGVYFARFSANHQHRTQKLLLLK
jgi:hypothetical protein